MIIGIPKEIKNHEYRVGATPSLVRLLVEGGHTVFVQSHAGEKIGYTDHMFSVAGAKIVQSAEEIYESEMIIKVKEPQSSEYPLLKEGQILFCYLHLAPDPVQTQQLIDSKVIAIAYETVKYYAGAVGQPRPDQNIHGFADPSHYDQTLSPISRPGSRASVMGQGGLLDAAGGIIEDLTSGGPLGLIGAAQKAGTAYNTFKDKNIKSIAVNEAVALGNQVLKGAVPAAMRQIPGRASGMYYPTPKE